VRLIAGEALGGKAVIETRTPVLLQDWTLSPGAEVEIPVPADFQVFAYVFEGAVRAGPDGREVRDGQAAVFGSGDGVRLSVPKEAGGAARLLLLGGVPLREPVARYGPFVMRSLGSTSPPHWDARASPGASARVATATSLVQRARSRSETPEGWRWRQPSPRRGA